VAEVTCQGFPGQFCHCTRHLHTRRAAAHEREGHPACEQSGISLGFCIIGLGIRRQPFGGLERAEYPAADVGGVFGVVEAGGDLLPGVVAEIVVVDAGRQDQKVIRQAVVTHQNALTPGVHAGDLAQQYVHVLLTMQDGSNGRRNLLGGQQPRGDLIEHRAEQVIVVPVNDGHAHGGMGQGLRGLQSAEAASYDYHVRDARLGRHILRHRLFPVGEG